MNIEQANTIPLTFIFEKLNVQPKRKCQFEQWYLSPLRNERTASFKIHTGKNVWYDFGEGEGGDTVSFVCSYLKASNEAHTVADALRWIRNMSFQPAPVPVPWDAEFFQDDSSLSLKSVKSVQHRMLIDYLAERKIPLVLADAYLKEVRIYNRETKKHFFSLGFQNEEEGYELRNKFFKGCLGTKTITFVRGANAKPSGLHIFEGCIDFLSALADHKRTRFSDDTIVLNSLNCLNAAMPYIRNYGYRVAYTWLDNDRAGAKGTKTLSDFFQSEESLKHVPMNKLYEPHKDVNDWRIHKLTMEQ